VDGVQDADLWSRLLGLEPPWTVERIELHVRDEKVDVYLAHVDGALWPCPECGRKLPAYDHKDERVWRHLDTMAFQTWVHARPPRVECPEHGVRQAGVPWAELNSRFTKFFERFAIDVATETDTKGAGKILKLSWDEVWGVQERAVARGLRAKAPASPRFMGVDEKAIGHGHQYATIVYNLEKGVVEWVGEDRKKETLDRFFASLTAQQLAGIEAVGLDMWGPFIASIREHVPGAEEKLVFDPFHIVGHMNEAVNDVRKREHRQLSEEGRSPLSGTRFWWLYGRENLPERHREGFAALQTAHLKTGRAYAIKEALRDLWAQDSSKTGAAYWRWWHFWATHSRLKPVIGVARMIKDHLRGVLNYFEHRITNAVAEGLNSKIATIQKMAYGFRNKDHFRTAVMFRCGGLQLHPVTHPNTG
jgi:transposase